VLFAVPQELHLIFLSFGDCAGHHGQFAESNVSREKSNRPV